jgi:hypothetical protein
MPPTKLPKRERRDTGEAALLAAAPAAAAAAEGVTAELPYADWRRELWPTLRGVSRAAVEDAARLMGSGMVRKTSHLQRSTRIEPGCQCCQLNGWVLPAHTHAQAYCLLCNLSQGGRNAEPVSVL